MKILFKSWPLLGVLLLVSCGGNTATTETVNGTETITNTENLPNPETAEKNSPEYKSAFAGQTRIAGVKTSTPYVIDVLNTSLGKPW